MFIEELIDRDGYVGELWNDANGHFCLINDQDNGDACWCACNPNHEFCRCECFHVFFMLLDRIYEENGLLNYDAKLKFALVRLQFWSYIKMPERCCSWPQENEVLQKIFLTMHRISYDFPLWYILTFLLTSYIFFTFLIQSLNFSYPSTCPFLPGLGLKLYCTIANLLP